MFNKTWIRTLFLHGNHSWHHNMELKTWRHVIGQNEQLIPLITGDKLRCPRGESRSCSTSGTLLIISIKRWKIVEKNPNIYTDRWCFWRSVFISVLRWIILYFIEIQMYTVYVTRIFANCNPISEYKFMHKLIKPHVHTNNSFREYTKKIYALCR